MTKEQRMYQNTRYLLLVGIVCAIFYGGTTFVWARAAIKHGDHVSHVYLSPIISLVALVIGIFGWWNTNRVERQSNKK